MLSYDPYGPEQIFPWKTIRKKFPYEGHMGWGDSQGKKKEKGPTRNMYSPACPHSTKKKMKMKKNDKMIKW